MTDDDPGTVELDGERLVTTQPGQRYLQTFPVAGITTCLRCGCLVDEQMTSLHDSTHD